eukprot:363948-Chlamydomonas_euryale.AAC.7
MKTAFTAAAHEYGLLHQPALSLECMHRLCNNGVMDTRLFAFMETPMCTCLPSPEEIMLY